MKSEQCYLVYVDLTTKAVLDNNKEVTPTQINNLVLAISKICSLSLTKIKKDLNSKQKVMVVAVKNEKAALTYMNTFNNICKSCSYLNEYSSKVINALKPNGKYTVGFKAIDVPSKVLVIKCIQRYTNLGLIDAKYIVDLSSKERCYIKTIDKEQQQSLYNELKQLGCVVNLIQ